MATLSGTGTALSSANCGTATCVFNCSGTIASATLSHDSTDASKGILTLNYTGNLVVRNNNPGLEGSGANPYASQAIIGLVFAGCNDGGEARLEFGRHSTPAGGCFTSTMAGSGSYVAKVVASSTYAYWTWAWSMAYGYWDAVTCGLPTAQCRENLTDNQRIWSPTGLTCQTDYASIVDGMQFTANLGSWGRGAMKGTPYTQGGGRSWNFQLQIKSGSTVLATKTLNTGENKTAVFRFAESEMQPFIAYIGNDLTAEITASNDYQQTVLASTNFSLAVLGWIVLPSGQTQKIASACQVNPDGSVQWIKRLGRRIG